MKIALIGPVPPPAGGMAHQTIQQQSLLENAGVSVVLIPTNADYRPAFIGKLPVVRAVFRLVQYLIVLLIYLRKVDVVHLMSNSGWSWHLFSAPALIVSRVFNVPVVINYRGGEAGPFFSKQWRWVKPFLTLSRNLVVPSQYLVNVFKEYGLSAQVIPNTLNSDLFNADGRDDSGDYVFVARNLEPIYGIDIAIRAFKIALQRFPRLKLVIAGSGPQEVELKQLVDSLSITDHVQFVGRLDPAGMAERYKTATVLLNPSKVDNSPNAVIEALACGACVVSSDVGGIPYLIDHDKTGLLVTGHNAKDYANALISVLVNPAKLTSLTGAGQQKAKQFDKTKVIEQWMKIYQAAAQGRTPTRGSIRTMKKQFDVIATCFIANVLFPLHERMKKHSTVQAYRTMMQNQWLSPGALEVYQNRELHSFMENISRHVPYYAKLFEDRKLDPASIQSKVDLVKLPFLTKALIKAHTEELKTTGPSQLSRFNTGGSSGEPLIFFIGNTRVSHDVAAKWRATRWWDVNIGDKEIVLWGSPIELGKQDRVKAIRDKLFRTELISAFELNDETKARIVGEIIKRHPPMLFGYPSVYAMLAEYAEQNGIDLSNTGVKVIFVTSEKLYDHQRELIQRVFNAPVANGYGGRDAGFIAHECPHGNMHITADDIVVEIIGSDDQPVRNGEAGEIVVTHLRTAEFPFVRYRTGDIGVLSDDSCPCGRGLPILKEVQGRTTDFITAMDGTQMHGLALIYHVRDVPGVNNFKIVQQSLSQTDILLEVNDNFDDSSLKEIKNNFNKRLGQDVTVTIEIVDRIASEKSGKYRYVVSKVGDQV